MDPGAGQSGSAQQRDLADILQNLFRAQPRTAPTHGKTPPECVAKVLPPEPSRSSASAVLPNVDDDKDEHSMLEQQDEEERHKRDARLVMLEAPAFIGSAISVHDWLAGPEDPREGPADVKAQMQQRALLRTTQTELALEGEARKRLEYELAECRQEVRSLQATLQRKDQLHSVTLLQKEIEIDSIRDALEASQHENQAQVLKCHRLEAEVRKLELTLADQEQQHKELRDAAPPPPPPPTPPLSPPPPAPVEREPEQQQKERLDWLVALQGQRLGLEERCHHLEKELRLKEEEALLTLERHRRACRDLEMKLEQQVYTHNTEQLELQLRLQQFHQKDREHRQQRQQHDLDWELVNCTLNNLESGITQTLDLLAKVGRGCAQQRSATAVEIRRLSDMALKRQEDLTDWHAGLVANEAESAALRKELERKGVSAEQYLEIMSDQEKTIEQMDAEIAAHCVREEVMGIEHKTLQSKHQTLLAQDATRMEQHRTELAGTRAREAELKNQIELYAKERADLKGVGSRLSAEKEKLLQEVDQQQRQLEDLDQRLARMAAENENLTAAHSELGHERDEIARAYAEQLRAAHIRIDELYNEAASKEQARSSMSSGTRAMLGRHGSFREDLPPEKPPEESEMEVAMRKRQMRQEVYTRLRKLREMRVLRSIFAFWHGEDEDEDEDEDLEDEHEDASTSVMVVDQSRELGPHAKMPVTSFSRRKGPVQRARESLQDGTPQIWAPLQAIQPRVIAVAQVPEVRLRRGEGLISNGGAVNDLASKLAARRRIEESANSIPSAPQAGDSIPGGIRARDVETSQAAEQEQSEKNTDHDEPEEPPHKFTEDDFSGSGSGSGSDVHDGESSDSGDHIAC